MAGDPMPIALPPPPDMGEEQETAAVMDIVVGSLPIEPVRPLAALQPPDEVEEQKTAAAMDIVVASLPVEPARPLAALPPPGEGEELKTAAAMDIVVASLPVEPARPLASLPLPSEKEEQKTAAAMDIVVASPPIEPVRPLATLPPPDEGEEQKRAAVMDIVRSFLPISPDINNLLDSAQQRGGCARLPEDLHNCLVCANLNNPMRGYVDTPCCSRNIICGRESYYPVGASLSNPEKWTCFLNCILQCVVHTVPLVSKLLEDDHVHACPRDSDKFCCYCSLKLHAAEIIKRSGCVLYPKKFVELLKLISENFEWGQHQDAHEFLRCLLDKLDETSVPPSPTSEGSSSIVQQIFGGQLKSQLRCPDCNHCSDRLEPFVDLNLEVTGMSSVMDALRSFTKIEVLENFTCDGCNCRVNMEKQFKVEQAPEVLVIQLKRFQNRGSYIFKIQGMVEYQLELDLNPFMGSPEDKHQYYDLYGVVEHSGVPSHGHYVCFIRPSQTDWFMFDDSKVMKISMDRALDNEAYLLFYVKQGSSPWFSTLLKRKRNVSSDSDEGSHSCSGSDNDEQEDDETGGSNDSPAGALGTLTVRLVGSNSKEMEDEPMKQFNDKVINELCRSGLTISETGNVAAGTSALETSRKEYVVETPDEPQGSNAHQISTVEDQTYVESPRKKRLRDSRGKDIVLENLVSVREEELEAYKEKKTKQIDSYKEVKMAEMERNDPKNDPYGMPNCIQKLKTLGLTPREQYKMINHLKSDMNRQTFMEGAADVLGEIIRKVVKPQSEDYLRMN